MSLSFGVVNQQPGTAAPTAKERDFQARFRDVPISKKLRSDFNGDADFAPEHGRMQVPIGKLIEDPKNERKVYRNMEGLIETVKASGVLEPITATPAANGKLMIVFGHRRWCAAKAARVKTVEVLIRDPEDENTRRLKSIISNVQRENVGPVELAESLAELLAGGKYGTQRELAQAIGCDETWVSGLLGILKLPSPLRRKLETSQVSIPYDVAIQIGRVTEPALQNALVETAVNGATVREIRKQISDAKPKPHPIETPFEGEVQSSRTAGSHNNPVLPAEQESSTAAPAHDASLYRWEKKVDSAGDECHERSFIASPSLFVILQSFASELGPDQCAAALETLAAKLRARDFPTK